MAEFVGAVELLEKEGEISRMVMNTMAQDYLNKNSLLREL